jgi:hypothetical protein
MQTRELAASILDLEARMATNTNASPSEQQEQLGRWNEMIEQMIGLLAPVECSRSAWRLPISSKITVNSGGRALTLTATNLSHTGVGARSQISWLAPGDEGELVIAESKLVKFALAVRFRVIWRRTIDGQCYYGLQFAAADLPEWHRGFRGWYLHAFNLLLHQLAAGETRWSPRKN